jgi:ABC-type Fe3+-hydroxamate transport system substrate-binding protein
MIVHRYLPALLSLCALGSLAFGLAACGGGTATSQASNVPLIAKDAEGQAITIPAQAPQRIISLGATDSEILGALKEDSRVIGVDAYTDYPADLAAKPKVTDANGQPNVEQIVALKPDLVLAYGGEVYSAVNQLRAAHVNVVDLPALNLSGSLNEIVLVGQLVHETAIADTLVASLKARIAAVEQKVKGLPHVRVYMEADDSTPGKPYAFGGGSFGDELIKDAGGTNIFAGDTSGGGYPQVNDEAVIAANPQVIVLTEDPKYGGDPSLVYQRTGYSAVDAVQHHQVYQMNTDLFQRPGPRMIDGLEQLAKLLHPSAFK